jgi:hypothetical protein
MLISILLLRGLLCGAAADMKNTLDLIISVRYYKYNLEHITHAEGICYGPFDTSHLMRLDYLPQISAYAQRGLPE